MKARSSQSGRGAPDTRVTDIVKLILSLLPLAVLFKKACHRRSWEISASSCALLHWFSPRGSFSLPATRLEQHFYSDISTVSRISAERSEAWARAGAVPGTCPWCWNHHVVPVRARAAQFADLRLTFLKNSTYIGCERFKRKSLTLYLVFIGILETIFFFIFPRTGSTYPPHKNSSVKGRARRRTLCPSSDAQMLM